MHIEFNEKYHTYTNKNTGERYTSVSNLLGQIKPAFDSDAHSKRVAAREGVSQQEVLERWEKNKQQSCDKGKSIHKIIEDYIRYNNTDPEWLWLYEQYNTQRSLSFPKYSKTYSEQLLYIDEFKLAGTCDNLIENKDEFSIFDFKTNKKIGTHSLYGEYLKYPLDYMQACEYNVYALQLSLYAYMYEKISNKRVRNLAILYIKDNNMTPYYTPYLKLEVKLLLNLHKQNKLA